MSENRVIPFDTVVQMLARNVPDRVVRGEAGVPLADDLGVAMGLVSNDRQRPLEAHRLAGVAQESPCSTGRTSCRQAEVNEPAVLIDRTP